jgi:hypothetical protein
MEVPGSNLTTDIRFMQGATTWAANRQFLMTPIAAGEPHVLTYSRVTNDAPCGSYYWYGIARPNGQALKDPASSYVQLIFAGGKQTPTGADPNPFISQQVSGNQVAIDPTYGLNEVVSSTTGSCSAACTKYSLTSVVGSCCSCNGTTGNYAKAAWNGNTFLCR